MEVLNAAEIRDAYLGPSTAEAATDQDLAAAAGAAAGGNLVLFDDTLSLRHRLDVVHSLLFAQLVAGGKADRLREAQQWYTAYETALGQLAWMVVASTATSRYLSPTPHFTTANVVSDVLRERVAPDLLGLVSKLPSAYASDPAGRSRLVFECPSHSGGLGNFQVAVARQDDEGDVDLYLARVFLDSPQRVLRVIEDSLDTSAKIQQGFTAMTLNEVTFEKLRPTLAKRLEPWLPTSLAPFAARALA